MQWTRSLLSNRLLRFGKLKLINILSIICLMNENVLYSNRSVLHRRTLLKRPRSIYSLTARLIKDQPGVFIVDVVTQAGTYIKELVHGEFGRTVPSLTSIVGQQLDIISLDVMGLLDIDWPPPRTTESEKVDNWIRESGQRIRTRNAFEIFCFSKNKTNFIIL